MDDQSNKIVSYHYQFKFEDSKEQEFEVKLDNKTLDLIQEVKNSYPEWTKLNFNKCLNCTLDEAKNEFCPTAVSIVPLVDVFSKAVSFEEVDTTVTTEERKYTKHTSLQKGLSSLIGIYMVTSGCPIMGKLKPMVRYHLPFATMEETKYRVISMYLLAQYFLYKKGKIPDWDMKNLVNLYSDIKTVNKSFFSRLSSITTKDASRNALIILNCFAETVSISIDMNVLKELEILFAAYYPPFSKGE